MSAKKYRAKDLLKGRVLRRAETLGELLEWIGENRGSYDEWGIEKFSSDGLWQLLDSSHIRILRKKEVTST